MPSTVSAVAPRLARAGCVAAEDEANVLVTTAADAATLESWIVRREQGEPLAWITGEVEFAGRPLRVLPGVYVPRPQTEVLARRASSLLAACEDGRAADLCTGSGAIAAHLARSNPGASVVAVDIDALAVRCARSNGVRAVLGDLGAPLRSDAYHVVTVVAPYVPSDELRFLPADVQRYEPRDALDGGADGLDVIRRVVASASRVLRRGGWLLVEVGGGQDRALAPAFATCGFDAGVPWFDEDGDLRGIVARRR